jgi:uncharacterized membrane protein YphA (DoxX/SURF4 family)
MATSRVGKATLVYMGRDQSWHGAHRLCQRRAGQVSWGETLVGVGLILGAFTGIAALFGSLMNMNYLLAGAVSINLSLRQVGNRNRACGVRVK